MKQNISIEISLKSIILIIVTLLLLFVAWKTRGVLIGLFIAFILMSGFAPLVDWLISRGFTKKIAIAITYIVSITIFALLLFFVIPPLIQQTRLFILNLSIYISWINGTFEVNAIPGLTAENITQIIVTKLDSTLSNVLKVALNAFSIFLTFITVAVFSFYLLLERESIKKNIHIFFPQIPKDQVYEIAHKIELKLGSWVRGELLLMLIIGTMTYIGLSILRIDYALPLAVIAGLLEIVPIIGPIISAIPAVLVAFVINPWLSLGVIALYILIQQLENTFIVPKLMERAVGLSPLLIIFSLLIGGSMFGLLGAVVAVPLAAIGHVLFEEFRPVSKE